MSYLSFAYPKVTTGSRLTDAFVNVINSAFNKLSQVLSTSRSFLIPAIKRQISLALSNATVGSLTLEEGDDLAVFGCPDDDGPHVRLTVLNDQFWIRLMLVQDLGFAEAYMAGEIAVSNLVDFVRFYIYNRATLETKASSSVVNALMCLANTRFGNSVLNTASNISAHYDLGNEVFETYLDATMSYSCAFWNGPNDTLEAAQMRKIDTLIDRAQLKPTDYLLDIGCGWGSLAMRAVERTGCRVLGITLSTEQKEAAERRISQAGMSDRITIMLVDYRKLDPVEYCFDKIISVEMVEHVGYEYLPVFFEQCHQLLHPQHGILVLQSITRNEEIYAKHRDSVDFIIKHVFPGGHVPSVSALIAAATKGSGGKLMLESAANYPEHYARTLRAWHDRFLAGYDKILATAAPKNPQLILQESELVSDSLSAHAPAPENASANGNSPGYNEVFRRKWEYYFAYCEGAYATRTVGCISMVFTRAYNEDFVAQVLPA
ncbi:hypothetical protein GGI02_005013 [Coemansia sp. RSA 2322]|nr:hypothetical protein GGI02_005013 [Coemansia sp. RSA 2322]